MKGGDVMWVVGCGVTNTLAQEGRASHAVNDGPAQKFRDFREFREFINCAP